MNRPDPDLIADYDKRVRFIFAQLESEKSSHMTKCKGIRSELAEIKTDAEERGLGKKAFNELCKHIALEIQLERTAERQSGLGGNLDEDADAEFKMMVQALAGDFGDTPLAAAAIKRAKKRRDEKAKVVDGLVGA